MSKGHILQVKGLVKYFAVSGALFSKTKMWIHAVDGVSFDIKKGEALGLVGESGSGKTTTAKCILGLTKPTAGEILFDGRNLVELKDKEMRKVRRRVSIVFQDPSSSLNPYMRVRDIVAEPLVVNHMSKGKELNRMVLQTLKSTGLTKDHMRRFPHAFSGGQKQRISIARAIIIKPALIVLDEPTSSLDVCVQAQILDLLRDLQKHSGVSYLFISHNLSVVKCVCKRVGIMYLGKILELGKVKDVWSAPIHPYTKKLFESIPVPDPELKKEEKLMSDVNIPSSITPPSGCRFHKECVYCQDRCKQTEPKLKRVADEHFVACHLV